MSAPYILGLMSFCFLFFGYLGVPVPFSLTLLAAGHLSYLVG